MKIVSDLKKNILKVLSDRNKARLLYYKEKYLIEEINKLKFEDFGVQEGIPYVKLKKGFTFFGFYPNNFKKYYYQIIKQRIKSENHFEEKYFDIVYDIISRYKVPRSLPGIYDRNETRYDPLRDPLNDFNIETSEKDKIRNIFQIKEDNTIIDIGAFLGYGTLKLSEYLNKKGKIYAFETDPNVTKILEMNINCNNLKNIVLIKKAVSNENIKGKFYSGGYTVNSLKYDTLSDATGSYKFKEYDVEIVKGDDELKKYNVDKVDYINITINGGEPEAIDGLKNIINNSNNLRLTTPGWYYRGQTKLADIIVPKLEDLNMTAIKGKLGRVLAWK